MPVEVVGLKEHGSCVLPQYFLSTKLSVLDALLGLSSKGSSTNVSRSFQQPTTRVQVNRMKASRSKETPGSDPEGLSSVFGQMFTSMRNSRCGNDPRNFDISLLIVLRLLSSPSSSLSYCAQV